MFVFSLSTKKIQKKIYNYFFFDYIGFCDICDLYFAWKKAKYNS